MLFLQPCTTNTAIFLSVGQNNGSSVESEPINGAACSSVAHWKQKVAARVSLLKTANIFGRIRCGDIWASDPNGAVGPVAPCE